MSFRRIRRRFVRWIRGSVFQLDQWGTGVQRKFSLRFLRRFSQKSSRAASWTFSLLLDSLGRLLPRKVKAWWGSRRFAHLWLGVPALIVCLAWLPFGIYLVRSTPVRSEVRYALAADAALRAQNFELARVAHERLLQLGSKRQNHYLFGLALSMMGLGQGREAIEIIHLLAPLDQPGLTPAHLYLANAVLVQPMATSNALATAQLHVQQVLKTEPANYQAHFLLGRLCLRSQDWEPARIHLTQALGSYSEAALYLAMASAGLRDELGTQKWANRAVDHFRARVETVPGDQAARQNLAEALVLLGDFAAAATVMERGLAELKQVDAGYLQGLGRVYATWAIEVQRRSPTDIGAQLKLVQQGLLHSPENEQLLRHLIRLTHVADPQASAAQHTLTALLAEGKASAALHLCLGIDAWNRTQLEEARRHLDLAFDLAPQMPIIANNLALVLALSQTPDLPRAMRIIQAVLDRYPNGPFFRETRGQVLLKMGKPREAILDFEFALPSLVSNRMTHLSLAEAYQQLGMDKLAQEHRRLAQTTTEARPVRTQQP